MFRVVSLTKSGDIDEYFRYDIEFNRKRTFSFGNGFGRNCIIFSVDMSSSVYATGIETRTT